MHIKMLPTRKFSDNIYKFKIYLLFFVGLFLYFFSPNYYSFPVVLTSVVVFLLSFITYLKYSRLNNYFNFIVLFSISFFFIYYAYPLFIFPVMKNRFFVFNFRFNEKIITKATGLSLVGYQALLIGACKKYEVKKNYKSPVNIRSCITILLISFAFLQFVLIKVFHYGNIYKGENTAGGLYGYFVIINHGVVFSSLTYEFNRLFSCKKQGKKIVIDRIIWLSIIFNLLVTLSTGSRTEPMAFCLAIIAGFSTLYNGISLKKLILLCLLGLLGLSFIGFLRADAVNTEMSFNILDMAMDLIINNFTLYLGYDYVQKNSLQVLTLFGSLFAAIPLLQGLLYPTFGIPVYTTTSALFFTKLVSIQNGKIDFGIGTNIVAGLYLATGFFGVLLFMFLLGRLIAYLQSNLFEKSVYALLLFFELMGISIYIVRADYFFVAGKFVFSLFFLMLFKTNILYKFQTRIGR